MTKDKWNQSFPHRKPRKPFRDQVVRPRMQLSKATEYRFSSARSHGKAFKLSTGERYHLRQDHSGQKLLKSCDQARQAHWIRCCPTRTSPLRSSERGDTVSDFWTGSASAEHRSGRPEARSRPGRIEKTTRLWPRRPHRTGRRPFRLPRRRSTTPSESRVVSTWTASSAEASSSWPSSVPLRWSHL